MMFNFYYLHYPIDQVKSILLSDLISINSIQFYFENTQTQNFFVCFEGEEPLPEGLFWLLLTGDVPSEAQVRLIYLCFSYLICQKQMSGVKLQDHILKKHSLKSRTQYLIRNFIEGRTYVQFKIKSYLIFATCILFTGCSPSNECLIRLLYICGTQYYFNNLRQIIKRVFIFEASVKVLQNNKSTFKMTKYGVKHFLRLP